MPIFDGLELAQMIRQPESKGNPYAPIIMLTGHSEKRRVTVARDAGVTEFLAKPISAKGLYQRILNVVANPRPFIKTKTYFGPDRRRNTTNAYIGPERRVGGEDGSHAAAVAARQGALQHLAAQGDHHGERKARDAADQELCRSPRHHAAQSPAQGVAARSRIRPRRSRRARGKGARRPVGRIQDLDDDRGRPAFGRACGGPAHGFTDDNREELFRAAHDIKGDAATFGFPSAAAAAESLCRIIEHAPDLDEVPPDLITHHINAIQAIVRERTKLDTTVMANALSRQLRGVADEFLIRVNRDRPEHLEAILAPSIVPAE